MSVGVKSISKLVSKYSNNHFYCCKKYFTSTSQNVFNSHNYKNSASCRNNGKGKSNVILIPNKVPSCNSQSSATFSSSTCHHYHQRVNSLTLSTGIKLRNNASKFPLQLHYNNIIRSSSTSAVPENNQDHQYIKKTNTKKPSEQNTVNQQVIEWIPIYRFVPIKWARLLQRIKIYQTFFSVCVITPVSIGCYVTGTMSMGGAACGIGGSAFACIMLLVTGTLASRVVGFMYTSANDHDVIKIARLDFWGKRKDEIFHVDDLPTLAEVAENKQDKFLPLIRYSDPKSKYYISIQQGLICDLEEFERVFGPVPRILGDYQIDEEFNNPKKQN